MMKKVTTRLAITVMLASLLISACSSLGAAKPTEREIEINPGAVETQAITTPQATPTLRPTPTATPLPTEGAIEAPTPTNTLNPYEALIFEGAQLRGQEQFEAAIAKFTLAIMMNANDPLGYVERAITYSNMGKQDEAITDFNFAINYDPTNADAYNGRGNAWAQKDQLTQAIKDYTKAIELKPDLVKAYNNRAIANILQRKPAEAFADFSKVIELTPDNAQAYYNRGQAYLKTYPEIPEASYIDLCIADFNQSIALAADQPESFYNRGTCYLYKNDYLNAFENYSQAIVLDPSQGRYFVYRALLYPNAGTADQALADAQKAIELLSDSELKSVAEQLLKDIPKMPTPTPGPSPTPGV